MVGNFIKVINMIFKTYYFIGITPLPQPLDNRSHLSNSGWGTVRICRLFVSEFRYVKSKENILMFLKVLSIQAI